MKEDMKTRKRNLWTFPMGTMGRDAIYSLFNNFTLTFILFTKNLNAAQLAAITGIMVAARIFDGLNDPIMGNIIEHTRTKYGKFKPWLTIGILLTSIVIYLTYNNSFTGWSFVWFFGVCYFAYSITYTMHDISYWGMIPALSSDADTRNMLTSRAALFAGIGGTFASILIPMFTSGENAIGGNAVTAYGRIGLILAVISPLILAITIFGVKEKRDDENKPVAPISLKKIVNTIAKNDQLVWVSVVFLIQQIGNGLIIGGIGSIYIYLAFGYEGGYWALFTTIGMSATAVLMVCYPAIARKIDRKRLMKYMTIISVAGYAIMLAAGLLMPNTSGEGANMIKLYVIILGYTMSNFGMYCFYLVLMISITNTVEYNEYKTGNRDEAIIASLRPFLTKMGSAIIALLTSLTYIIFGVLEHTNAIADFENQANSGAITEAAKLAAINAEISTIDPSKPLALLLCMTIVPCAMMIIAYTIYKKKYKLDETEYERICAELANRQ